MGLTEIIADVNALNEEGVAKSMANDYPGALALHKTAAQEADVPGLNPDYYLTSHANQSYNLRKLGISKKDIVDLLERGLKRAQENDFSPKTLFGTAHVLEEMAIVLKDNYDSIEDLENAAILLEDARKGYLAAGKNPEQEIVPVSKIKDRLYRIFGLSALAYEKLAEVQPDKKESYLNKAISLAKDEVSERENDGDTSAAMLNAYHGLGDMFAKRVTARHSDEFIAAKKAYDAAFALIEEYEGPQQAYYDTKKSVLQVSMAMLHLNAGSNVAFTSAYVKNALDTSDTWNPDVKASLKKDLFVLAPIVNGPLENKIYDLYDE